MSVVHYKFKNSLEYDSVTFDGLAISLADLKKAVMFKKRMKAADSDLQVINAQTNEEYKSATTMIPKNTSLTVSRIPVAAPNRQGMTAQAKAKKWEAFRQETQAALVEQKGLQNESPIAHVLMTDQTLYAEEEIREMPPEDADRMAMVQTLIKLRL